MKTTAVPIEVDGEITGYRISGAQAVDLQRHHRRRPPRSSPWPPAARPGSSSSKGTEGFTSAKPEDKHGIRLSNTAALFLDDVEVPIENLIGGVEGQGLVQAQQVFGYTRVMVAAFGLGGGWEAVDRAIALLQDAHPGGAPLAEKQGYTHKLIVPHVVRLEAARAFIEETADAHRRRRGPRRSAEHRGRDRQVPGHRGRQPRRRGRHPGPRRLRLHPRVRGREDQARRAHHHDLRGHLRDHGDDDRPRPLAGAPEVPRRLLPDAPRRR